MRSRVGGGIELMRARFGRSIAQIVVFTLWLFVSLLHFWTGFGFGLPDGIWIFNAMVLLVWGSGYLIDRILSFFPIHFSPHFESLTKSRTIENTTGIPCWLSDFLQRMALGMLCVTFSIVCARLCGLGLPGLFAIHISLLWLGVVGLLVQEMLSKPASGEVEPDSAIVTVSRCDPLGRALQTAVGLILLAATLISVWGLVRVGSFVEEDALVHLAHVRDLLDMRVLDVNDPLYGGESVDSRYQGSLYHPFLALTTLFSGAPYTHVWHLLSAIFLPLSVCVLWGLGTVLFRSNLVGLCSALVFVTVHALVGRMAPFRGDLLDLAYPGGVALYFLTPLLWYLLWNWRNEGARLQLVLLLGIAGLLAGTHIFYALLFAGGAAVALPLLAVLPGAGDRPQRIRTMMALAAVLLPLALVVSLRWNTLQEVSNPFFVQGKSLNPLLINPPQPFVESFRSGEEITADTTWRLEWQLLFEHQGIRLFECRLPRLTFALCFPLLFLFWRKKAAAALLLAVLMFLPYAINLFPPVLHFLQDKISIYKVIRLGQMAPHALIAGWALERLMVGVAFVVSRILPAGSAEKPLHQSFASVLLVTGVCAYIGLDALAANPLLEADRRIREAAAAPMYQQAPYRVRDSARIGLISFFAARSEPSANILCHSYDSLLLAAYTGYNVVVVPSFHAAPGAADAQERETLTGQLVRGEMTQAQLAEMIEKYRIDRIVFHEEGRSQNWLRSEGHALLDDCPLLFSDDAPQGYKLWRTERR